MNRKQSMFMGAGVTGFIGILTGILLFKKSSLIQKGERHSFQLKKESNHEKFLLGSVVGGLTGVALSFLFAPQSGKDLIKNIMRHLHKVEKRVDKAIHSDAVSAVVKKRTGKKRTESTVATKTRRTAPSYKSSVKKHSAAKKARVVKLDSKAI